MDTRKTTAREKKGGVDSEERKERERSECERCENGEKGVCCCPSRPLILQRS